MGVLELLVPFRDKQLWHQLFLSEILEHMNQPTYGEYHPSMVPPHERWKLILFIGNRAKNVLKVDRNLHWQLRQSFESYLGHMLYSLYYMMPFDENWSMAKQIFIGVGITFAEKPWDTRNFWDLLDPHKDKSLQRGFDAKFLGMTDRWGTIREHDDHHQFLIAKACHNADSEDKPRTCRLRYKYHKCGCECPYFHMETQKLGEQLMQAARRWSFTTTLHDPENMFSPWEFSIHQRDIYGGPAFRNFPHVRGLAMLPSQCMDRGATAGRTNSVHSLFRINAVADETQEHVNKLMQDISDEWEKMRH